MPEDLDVALDLRRRPGARDDGRDARMPQRELEGGGGERHTMPLADRLDPRHRRVELRGRRAVVRVGALPRPGGEDARLVRRTDDEADAALHAGRELRVQDLLAQQRVGHRDEEEVEVHDVQEPGDHAQLVDTRTDAPDEARAP